MKGTTWMVVSTGKKVTAGLIIALACLGGGTATMLLRPDSQTEVDNKKNEVTDAELSLNPEMKILIVKIKENEKRYENIEVEMRETNLRSGELIDPVQGGELKFDQPVRLDENIAAELDSLPFDFENGAVLPYLKSLHRKVTQISQDGRTVITGNGKLIHSNIYFDNGDYYQEFKKYDWNQQTNSEGTGDIAPPNQARILYPPILNLNPYSLFLAELPESTVPLSLILTGGAELKNSLTQINSNQNTSTRSVNYHSKIIETTKYDGENVQIVEVVSEPDSEPKAPFSRRHLIYLAIDKNYLPMKWEVSDPRSLQASTLYEVKSWTEPEPGTWYPEETEVSFFKSQEDPLLMIRTFYKVISLAPHYPVEFFRIENSQHTAPAN